MVFYVKTMCRILKVTRSRYYFWLKKPLSQREIQEEIIKDHIIYYLKRKPPNLRAALGYIDRWQKKGIHCGKKKIERIIREVGLKAVESNVHYSV